MDSVKGGNFVFIACCVGLLLLVVGFLSNRSYIATGDTTAEKQVPSAVQMRISNNDVLDGKEIDRFFKDVMSERKGRSGKNFLDDAMNHVKKQQYKLELAAGAYIGFEVRNTLALKEFCGRYGVDVALFSAAVLNEHEGVASRVKDLNITTESREASFKMLRRHMMPVIQDEMAIIAEKLGKNTGAACVFVKDNADQLAKINSFKRLYPAQYNLLMSK